MRSNSNNSRESSSNIILRLLIFIVLFLILSAIHPSYPGSLTVTSPPDLSDCERIEIRYPRGALGYFIPSTALQNILSPEERKYIQSFKSFVVSDQERINAFARDMKLGTYRGYLLGVPFYAAPVHITCYRNNKQPMSFTVYGKTLVTEDKHMFEYPIGLPNLEIIEPMEMGSFKLRFHCAWNMQRLYTRGPIDPKDVSSYAEPDQWCDAIVRVLRDQYFIDKNGKKKRRYSEKEISRIFKCPSAHELVKAKKPNGEPNEPNSPEKHVPLLECHYAMNPNCKPNSPPDMVLIFETKAGWNQNGGPELFTFDNHDPKGGCVLLNNGTVKFIRTKEELHQLRWK